MPIEDSNLLELANQSYSIADLLNRLGLKPCGGNHLTYKKRLIQLNFQGFIKRPFVATNKLRLKLAERLVKGNKVGNSKLRKSLIRHGILKNECSECGLGPVWCNKPISLHLDHIDGDRFNNRLDNLRILCPNCHSQTETYSKLKS